MVNRTSALVILAVARYARRRESCEDTARSATVARLTGCHIVRADQGESIGVMLHRIDLDPPAFHRVAVFAGRAKLPAMEVRVT